MAYAMFRIICVCRCVRPNPKRMHHKLCMHHIVHGYSIRIESYVMYLTYIMLCHMHVPYTCDCIEVHHTHITESSSLCCYAVAGLGLDFANVCVCFCVWLCMTIIYVYSWRGFCGRLPYTAAGYAAAEWIAFHSLKYRGQRCI